MEAGLSDIDDTDELPIPPDDLRFLVAVERWKKFRAQPAVATLKDDTRPPGRSPASLAAERILNQYTWHRPPETATAFIDFVSFSLACMLIPATTLYLFAWDPSCGGKNLRLRLWHMKDVRRFIVNRRQPRF